MTEKQVRPQSNELLSLKGRAGVDGSRNADPQALSCNLATQGFLCVITPHLPGTEKPAVAGGSGTYGHSHPQGKSVYTLL